jgi:serine/threonine kinase PknH
MPQMRRLLVALAVAGVCVVAAACSSSPKTSAPASPSPTSSSPPPPEPVALSALEGLLLSPDQINTAMGATAMTVSGGSATSMVDHSPEISPTDCLAVAAPPQEKVYAGSGWSAVRHQLLHEPGAKPGDDHTHTLIQDVVSFASANTAAAFFDTSTHRWRTCANQQYTRTEPGTPNVVWTVGPVSNTNGTLSATKTEEGGNGNGWTCQRALTVANNVAIDISACGYNLSESAVNIAHQIAAKVPT